MYLNYKEGEQVLDWLNYLLSLGNVDDMDIFYTNCMVSIDSTPSKDLQNLIKKLEIKLLDDATG